MNNRITKFLAIALFLLNISQVAKGEAVDAVTGATPVKLKIEANADKQLVLDVSYEENSVIREAPLGLNVDHRLLGKDAQQLSKEKKENNTLVYEFQQVDGSRFFLDARIFPDGIALRYPMRRRQACPPAAGRSQNRHDALSRGRIPRCSPNI